MTSTGRHFKVKVFDSNRMQENDGTMYLEDGLIFETNLPELTASPGTYHTANFKWSGTWSCLTDKVHNIYFDTPNNISFKKCYGLLLAHTTFWQYLDLSQNNMSGHRYYIEMVLE